MAPPSSTTASNKPPVAPDLDLIFNRISMGMAKHRRILETLKKPVPQVSSGATSAAPSVDSEDSSSSAAPRKGFSSLSKSTTTATKPSPTPTDTTKSQRAAADDDSDLNPYFQQPPNAGIGWTPAPSASSFAAGGGTNSAAERMLKMRLLGGRKGMLAAAAAAAAADEKKKGKYRKRDAGSDSEEDMGRSAVGRSKKRSRVVPVPMSIPAPVGETGSKEQTLGDEKVTVSEPVVESQDGPVSTSAKEQESASSVNPPSPQKRLEGEGSKPPPEMEETEKGGGGAALRRKMKKRMKKKEKQVSSDVS
ncbi:hypothetical protein B0T19DRAFT_430641 [Cercophora scortea]|uniref:Uncharacterized protein n=1 Tax=Cercophora scortea TaxID=314031 RepID=A0AAE0IA04_9PEZI|nr:hypothetical protein B0T19DRAFT_430641 [Cercophora scortea]